MLLSAGLTWIRQYLFIRTSNRIDAVLGSKVFTHLFHLLLGYFEQRPTRTLAAYLQGVETIRNSSAARRLRYFSIYLPLLKPGVFQGAIAGQVSTSIAIEKPPQVIGGW